MEDISKAEKKKKKAMGKAKNLSFQALNLSRIVLEFGVTQRISDLSLLKSEGIMTVNEMQAFSHPSKLTLS